MGSWHWGLRVTPVFGAVAVLLILLVVQDPPRSESEGAHLSATSWWDDIKSLGKNFVMSTAACTAVAFVAGALAWWGPKFIALGLATQQGHQDVSLDDVSYIFGLIAMIAGLLGVPLGSFLGQKLRAQISEILKKSFSTPAAFVEGAMVLNSTVSSIVSDFVTSSPDMNVSANCSSSGTSSIDLTTVEGDFKALQWAMSITIVVEVLGALFFFGTAWYIVEDKAKVDRAVADGPRGFRAVSMKELPASLMWNGHPSDLVTSKKIGLGFDDEARQLSPSRNRRPDSNGTPEEEQPITIIAPASDYLSVI